MIIQSITNTANTSATVSANITTTVGNALIVLIDVDLTFTVSGITGGGTWTLAQRQIWNFSSHSTEIWYCPNNIGGALTVQATMTGAANSALIVAEYPSTDIIAISPLDKTASQQSGDGVNSSPADSGNTTITAMNYEILIGGVSTFDTNAQITATGGFTKQANAINPIALVTLCLLDRPAWKMGTYHTTASLSPTAQWGALISTFFSIPRTIDYTKFPVTKLQYTNPRIPTG